MKSRESILDTHQTIIKKLIETFSPSYLEVLNESDRHSGPKDAQTHFKITIVTGFFEKKRSVARHQLIYQTLADELASEVHALAIHTFSLEEWKVQQSSPDSPHCLGGSQQEKSH